MRNDTLAIDGWRAREQRRQRAVESLSLPEQQDERLDRITRLARRVFDVDWTSVTVLDGDRARFPSAQGFDTVEAARGDTFSDRTTEVGDLVVVEDATRDPRYADLPAVRDHGIRFYVGAPLRDRTENIVGVFCLYDRRVRTIDGDDLKTFEDLAAWAEHELVASSDMAHAGHVQASMLPSAPIRVDGWDIDGICIPALAVGGDLFDYGVVDGVVHLGMADVMGKGTGAALLGAGVRTALRSTHAAVVAGVDLGVTVTQVARGLAADLQRAESFVTLLEAAIDLDDGYLRYVDAGLGLCLIVRADGEVVRLTSDDLPLGVLPDSHWTELETTLEPGDRLLLFSDGLLDLIENPDEWWHSVGDMVARQQTAAGLLGDIARLTAQRVPLDDVTAVAVYRPAVA